MHIVPGFWLLYFEWGVDVTISRDVTCRLSISGYFSVRHICLDCCCIL
jgi:hypothetical protein